MTTTTNNETMQVAKTIVQQIPVMDKMAVGYRKPIALDQNENRIGGLSFSVNNRNRFVRVELQWNDTYKVTYFRVKRTKTSIDHVEIAQATDVYCDCLGTTIYNMTQQTKQFNEEN
tara:strand:+ start:424 stop:771 length:348 start_codon:yes stop_codon:yes gene_type:complete